MGQIGRRRFLTALGATALAGPFVCAAQRATRMPRVGILSNGTADSNYIRLRQRWFNDSMARAGYVPGTDVLLEWRFAEGNLSRLDALAAELVRLKVDVIVGFASGWATTAAKRATSTIPIVMYAGGDYQASHFVGNLARPIGNVTGTLWATDQFDATVKRYELLREAMPSAVRVAELNYDPRWASSLWPGALRAEQIRANQAYGFDVANFAVGRAEEIPSALDRITEFKPHALYINGGGPIRSGMHEIVRFALLKKLVTIGTSPQLVYEGGLLYYGPDVRDVLDRTVNYVVRILRGAKPAELPVERPSSYVLLLNATTARAIGYTPPAAFQLRIDSVIE
jgi:putative ABC transport system substrate-binding protein